MIAPKPGDRPIISDIVRNLKEKNEQYFCTSCLNQPEEHTSQAVIAEEQMVEWLENAKFLSENKHYINMPGNYRSIHGHEETLSRVEEPQDLIQFPDMRWGLRRCLQPDVLQNISNKMGLELKSKGQHTVTFHVHWNLLKFCKEELEGNCDLATVLTVTGTGKIAFATTCQEYVARYWPNTGQDVLVFLESAILQRKHQVQISPELYISMDLSAWYSPTKDEYAMVQASGSQRDLIHVAQQIAWMSAVFRVPRDGELTYSDVIFEQRGPLEFGLMLMDLQKVKNTPKACWHSLFVSSVIARGFSTPDRENDIGIEVPFEVMISLACILYPMDYHGGTILRGMRLTLVPTAYCSGSVQWHCVSSEQDSYLPRANELMKEVPEWFKTPDFELLRTSRTFLGYCRVAEIHLGTSGTDYKRIQISNAALEPTRAAFSREFSSSLGVSAKGIMTATWSPKVTFPRGLRATTKQINLFFHDRLLRARDQPSIIYDVEKKIGWLVPELSVVLHNAHTWASQQPDISADVLKKIPYASVSENGAAAAWDAIMEGKGVELRKDSLDGKPQLFGDVINNLLTALENRKDVAVDRDNPVFNFRFATSSGLRGWEFIDLANWNYLSNRKEVNMDRKTAGEWCSIAAENPDLMVLFCKGLEQLIRPAKHQKHVVYGHQYLKVVAI